MSTYRVAIAGIGIESSTFSAHRTTLGDFTVWRGEELAPRYPFLPGWRIGEVEFVPVLVARALPGGPLTEPTYRTLRGELLDGLRTACPLDGVLLDLHGAMHVEGMLDAEADLVAAIRKVVGPTALLSAAMDLHGQVSHRLARQVELLTAYRTAPHVDTERTRQRACRNLARCLTAGIVPVRARVRVPVLLPGERTSTRLEPARSIYASLADSERLPGVIDAALWVGYAWADEPRSAAAVVVTAESPRPAMAEAARIARAWWRARHDFRFCAPAGPADWAIGQALADPRRPFFVSDTGDNPGAGGSGDAAWLLDRLLATPRLASGERTAVWAGCVDPDAVATCHAAGEGGRVELTVGGVFGGPGGGVRLAGQVLRLRAGDPVAGAVAVVRSGGVHAVLTARRKAFHTLDDLASLGLHPGEQDLTAVKIGYLEPTLHAAGGGWVLALTPGGVDQELSRLDYRKVSRPVYPLDSDPPEPDLTPVLLTGPGTP